MTNKSPTVQFDVPAQKPVTEYRRVGIKWCDGHWAELMFALKDRGLEDKIAPSDEALNQKLINGEGDPCWDAFQGINVGAMEIFGATKIMDEYGGCPVCAFANIIDHAADLVTAKYRSPH